MLLHFAIIGILTAIITAAIYFSLRQRNKSQGELAAESRKKIADEKANQDSAAADQAQYDYSVGSSTPTGVPIGSSESLNELEQQADAINRDDQVAELRRILPLYEADIVKYEDMLKDARAKLEWARHTRETPSGPLTLGSRAIVSDSLLTRRLNDFNYIQSELSALKFEYETYKSRLEELLGEPYVKKNNLAV